MSRIGNKPIETPEKVDVTISADNIVVKGPLGELTQTIHPLISVTQDGNVLKVSRTRETRDARALHGLHRALIQNMVTGVSQGFKQDLELFGVGYRAELKGTKITLNLGYSHPIEYEVPATVKATVKQTKIQLESVDKQLLGQTTAEICSFRVPDAYKAKGVRRADRIYRKKAGKAAAK